MAMIDYRAEDCKKKGIEEAIYSARAVPILFALCAQKCIITRVKLTPFKIYALKLALYTGGLLYIALDLFVMEGPLWGMMYSKKDSVLTSSPVALSVYGDKTTAAQLQRRSAELTSVMGEQPGASYVYDDIIHSSLLRMRARYNDGRIPDFSQMAKEEVERLSSRATNAEAFGKWLQSQGMDIATFENKLQATMRMQYYLENTISDSVQVTDEEVASLISQMSYYLAMPESRRVKHIFFDTLNKDENKVKEKAEAVLNQLTAATGEEQTELFARLADTHSADARTATRGGDLGVVTSYPAPVLKELNLFGDNAIAANVPTLQRSKWGWHIILADEINEARELTPEECAESIRTAIKSFRQKNAVDSWIEANVNEGEKKNRIITHEQ